LLSINAVVASGRSSNGWAVLTPLRGFPGPSLPARAFAIPKAMLNGFLSPLATTAHPAELRAHKPVCYQSTPLWHQVSTERGGIVARMADNLNSN